MNDKSDLRKRLRAERHVHVAGLAESTSALVFSRPPRPVTQIVPETAVVGLYATMPDEAPTLGYANWFHENGYSLALPWFEDRNAPMQFRTWRTPYDADELEPGPFGIPQPRRESEMATPVACFVPLLGFTAQCERLGQGGGHYDRWLEQHPDTIAIGLGWDCQLVETLPVEAHDIAMRMVITPTRLFEDAA